MMGGVILSLVGVCLTGGLVLMLFGVRELLLSRRKVAAATGHGPARARLPVTVHLDGEGQIPTEPGVLLNTLWEHLPNAECHAGECGGCKLRLLEGGVIWIREPVAQLDQKDHILACSCEAVGQIRCAKL